MADLKVGTVLKTKNLKTVTVRGVLGSGGQGTVYLVDYVGKEAALKWYHETACKGRKKEFLDNLIRNIDMGAPAQAFLWPLDLTEISHGSVGYIMELRPREYVEMSQLLLTKNFASFQACADAMINVVNAFRILHNKGLSYQDLNDGNFFFNPQNGKLLICDNDNVAPFGYSMGISGKARYVAPEVVLGDTEPNKSSDRFSLALILFLLLCKAHPLEGSKACPACLTGAKERAIYGETPVFIFDPNDDCNRPIKGVHVNPILIWPELPNYLQETFIAAFSQKALKNPGARVIEHDWLDVLIRFRNSILKCPHCGNEELTDNQSNVCTSCNKPLEVKNSLRFPKYSLPAVPGVKIYKHQLSNCSDEEATDVVGIVIQSKKDPEKLGIANVSGSPIVCEAASGGKRIFENKEVIPLKGGQKISIMGIQISVD